MVAAWRRGARRSSVSVAMLLSMLVWCAAADAAPADDHERGLQAYRRGDVVGAMAALRGPAQAGHGPSQSLLAFILDHAGYHDEAAQLYRDAAAQDDAEGHAGLASLYLTGRGVAKDEKLALRHFSKAAELGHASSVNVLADAYLKKQYGLDADGPDGAAALGVWRRAAGQGHLASAQALAMAYRAGRHGVAADPAQAAAWQARADELRKQQQAAAPARAPK
jgi:TPR repeat protein